MHPHLPRRQGRGAPHAGGTGGLRVAADFLAAQFPKARVLLSQPTWPNHPSIFHAAGLETAAYPYFDAATNALAFERMTAALAAATPGDIVVLHGCCHNPTGIGAR
jgi:aspartate/tyrosine/aromatic aminotransferase